MKRIFQKLRLTPGQLRAVAERRFGDANYLLESGKPARANGAMYLAGFTIECLLKALLFERHPNLEVSVDPAKLSKTDHEVYELLYRHDLERMLLYLPEMRTKLENIDKRLWRNFSAVCEEWTIHARYAPKQVGMEDARQFVNTVREVKSWLKQL